LGATVLVVGLLVVATGPVTASTFPLGRPELWLTLLVSGLLSGAGAAVLFTMGIRLISRVRAGVMGLIEPIVGTAAAMGVIPLGTANMLAVDLGIPRNPVLAARALLAAERRRIAVGRIEYSSCTENPHPGSPETGETRVGHPSAGGAPRLAPENRRREPGAPSSIVSRYFTVTAGIGADAHLFYSMNYAVKRRLGNLYYHTEAMRVWATHKYPLFEVEYANGSGEPQRAQVSQVLAVRITTFGGLLRHLAPGAALKNNSMRLVLFKTQSRTRYLQYMTAVLCGRKPNVPRIEFADATSVQCRPLDGADCPIHAEADGELLGILPAKLDIVPEAVTLLMPS
jgi:diacylglycerol kinase family enzyme